MASKRVSRFKSVPRYSAERSIVWLHRFRRASSTSFAAVSYPPAMSSTLIPGKHTRSNSFSDSLEISDLSFAPTPPPRGHAHQQSFLSSFTESEVPSSSSEFGGSVIWNKSSRSPRLFDPDQTSRTCRTSEFTHNHASSMPQDSTSLESFGRSWLTASSSFQTGSSATLNDSALLQAPECLDLPSASTLSFEEPLRDGTQSPELKKTALQTTTTLPSIPGYGSIRLTVTMDLPPPPHHFQHTHTSVRIDTPMTEVPSTVPSETSVDAALESFSAAELRQLLRCAVQKHPGLAPDITSSHPRQTSHARSKSTNFVHYSNSVWHTLNARKHPNTEKRNQHAERAAQRIATDISTVATQISPSESLATKKNALETLRKIGRSICLATGNIGDRVKEVLGPDGRFVEAIVKVALSFTREDRRILWAGGSGAEIVKRLDQLDELRKCYRVFEGFDVVLKLLKRGDDEDFEDIVAARLGGLKLD